jgi:transcriptional regulator with XRE-family HTH domain
MIYASTIFVDMKPAQARAGRALIGMTQGDLAQRAGVSLSTVVDFERDRRAVAEPSVSAIRAALEAAGVVFLAENGGGPGVRLRK